MWRIPSIGAALALLAGCATAPAEGPLVGEWGGEHIGLTLTASGGSLDYDCAAGTIDAPLAVTRDGTFIGAGTHTPGQGGPDRIDYTPPSYPARYSGRVSGDRMTLRVDVPARNLAMGPFRLRRGAEPRLLRCL